MSCNTAQNKQPNVILFVVDDLGWTDLASYGSDLYQTPNVDKLASRGIRFTDAYAACTVCSPSRYSLMTGKYPARGNCTDWISGHKKPFAKMKIPNWNQYLDHEEVTLAEVLRGLGYKTVHIGKWHLGEDEKYWPEKQGFDENIGGWAAGAPQKKNGGSGYFSPYKNPRLEDGPKDEYLTERLSDEAVNFIENNKNGKAPFFMNFWFYNVHMPLQARKEKVEKYKKLVKEDANHKHPTYAAMVEHMDDAIGEVIQKLEDSGILENTIIIFTSDNGGIVGNSGSTGRKATSNVPLRSGKGDIYEGGVRVPFIAQWEGEITKGEINNTPIISADIYPTILGLTRIEGDKNHNKEVDGVDLSKLLTQSRSIEREALFWHYPHYHSEGAKPYSAIRKGDWKLIQVFENDSLELYNLKADINESVNLALKHPEKVNELWNDLNNWRQEVSAQLPEPNPLFDETFENTWKKGVWEEKTDQEYLEYLKNEI